MGASVERDLSVFLWLMSVDFPGLTSHAGGASGKRSSNYTAGPCGRKAELLGFTGVENGWSGLTYQWGGDGVVKEGSWCLKKWQAVRTVCQWNHDQDWKNSILQHTDWQATAYLQVSLTKDCHRPLSCFGGRLATPIPTLTFTFAYHLPRLLLSFTWLIE